LIYKNLLITRIKVLLYLYERVVFFRPLALVVLFRFAAGLPVLFFGTFAPFLRASDNPMAIACFRLVTFFPEPLLSVPRFFRFIALFTVS
jgi:hypothetical protein